MIAVAKNIYDYRELLQVLVWKNITLRYKQSYLGMVWLVLRPLIFDVYAQAVGTDARSQSDTRCGRATRAAA